MSSIVGDSGAGQLGPMWVDIDMAAFSAWWRGQEVDGGDNDQQMLIIVNPWHFPARVMHLVKNQINFYESNTYIVQ